MILAPPPPPPPSLAVSPARLAVAGGGSAVVEVRSPGLDDTAVDAAVARYALDASGRPRVIPGHDGIRLVVRPRTAIGSTVQIVVTARVARGARPGDHPELLVLTTRPVARAGVGVRLRVGVPVVVRVAGTVVHDVVVVRAAVARGVIRVVLQNRGNVVEALSDIRLVRGSRVIARPAPARREVLPGARALLRLAWHERIRGLVRLVVRLRDGAVRSWLLRVP